MSEWVGGWVGGWCEAGVCGVWWEQGVCVCGVCGYTCGVCGYTWGVSVVCTGVLRVWGRVVCVCVLGTGATWGHVCVQHGCVG